MTKETELKSKPIPSLVVKYSIPAFIALLVNTLYNIVDRAFIGQVIGEEALAGITIAFPIMFILFSSSVLIGGGGAALISLSLGKSDNQSASNVHTHAIFICVALSITLVLLGYVFMDYSLMLFGAEKEVLAIAKEYLQIIYIGVIFWILAFVLSSIVRAEGFPMLSMVVMVVSAVLNIILDFLFIAVLEWGISGAAYATIIGQLIGFIILVKHFASGKSTLVLVIREFKFNLGVTLDIFKIGASSFITTLGSGLALVFLTSYISKYGGTSAVAAFGAISSLTLLLNRPAMGLQQGLQPIFGFNYGAKNFSRVRSSMRIGNWYSFIVGMVLIACVFLFPKQFLVLFFSKDATVLNEATYWLKIYVCMLPLIGINLIGAGYFQAINVPGKATLLAASRQLIFLVPLVLLLTPWMGMTGVWAATPMAEFLSIILSLLLLLPESKRLNLPDNRKST